MMHALLIDLVLLEPDCDHYHYILLSLLFYQPHVEDMVARFTPQWHMKWKGMLFLWMRKLTWGFDYVWVESTDGRWIASEEAFKRLDEEERARRGVMHQWMEQQKELVRTSPIPASALSTSMRELAWGPPITPYPSTPRELVWRAREFIRGGFANPPTPPNPT